MFYSKAQICAREDRSILGDEVNLRADQAALLARLSSTGTEDDLDASISSALRCSQAGPELADKGPAGLAGGKDQVW